MVFAKFNILRSRDHTVTTERLTKVALSSEDDKRFIIQDHKTLSIGHWRAKYPSLYTADIDAKKTIYSRDVDVSSL